MASIILKMIEGIGHKINPAIFSLDPADSIAIAEYTLNLPVASMVFILFAYFISAALASFTAAFMTSQFELQEVRRNAYLAAACIFIYVVISMLVIRHPSLMIILGPILALLGGLLGYFLFNKMRSSKN